MNSNFSYPNYTLIIQLSRNNMTEYITKNETARTINIIGNILLILIGIYMISDNLYKIYTNPQTPTFTYTVIVLELIFILNFILMLITSLASTSTLYFNLRSYLIIIFGIMTSFMLFAIPFFIYGVSTAKTDELREMLVKQLVIHSFLSLADLPAYISFFFIYRTYNDIRF